jgi:hypothetical protein
MIDHRGVNPERVPGYWVITENRLRGLRVLVFNIRLRNRVPRLTDFYPGTQVNRLSGLGGFFIVIIKKKSTFLGFFLVLDLLFLTSFILF